MMDTVQAIALAFDYSAKRLLSFKENLEANAQVKEEMVRRQKLKTLFETRWASRSDSLNTFLSAYNVVVDSLEDLEQQGDSKARGYACSIDFIVSLVVVQSTLQPLVPLSAMLQNKEIDLIEAVAENKVVIEQLRRNRNEDGHWDDLFHKATVVAASVNEVPVIPRGVARQVNRVNVPAVNPSQYWKRAMYLPFVDHLIQELTSRLVKNEDRFAAQTLIPQNLHVLTNDMLNKIFTCYHDDLTATTVVEFQEEVDRWRIKWDMARDPTCKLASLSETLAVTNFNLYPNIFICLSILITMPVATATAERSFSLMRRVKTHVRSTMLSQTFKSLSATRL
ncbi:uncharacterized protein LOC133182709 [Saccostrea echinata]|uniref:uncharacterized protein LOC133182709 n=1 Tax=Saccostrea echinata TaxID=191078 RepID=UPI002A823D91|nr:uncharacterized protein LOC133182709 [Saccostrea echinata]